jgi:hypothetical protein
MAKREPKFFDPRKVDEQLPFTIPEETQERCSELELLFERHYPKDIIDISRVYNRYNQRNYH